MKKPAWSMLSVKGAVNTIDAPAYWPIRPPGSFAVRTRPSRRRDEGKGHARAGGSASRAHRPAVRGGTCVVCAPIHALGCVGTYTLRTGIQLRTRDAGKPC